MKGAELLVRCLEHEGVGVVFGVPGEETLALTRAFGCRGARVEAADELVPALETAFAGPGPCLVEVPVDYRENFRLTERLGQLVCPL